MTLNCGLVSEEKAALKIRERVGPVLAWYPCGEGRLPRFCK